METQDIKQQMGKRLMSIRLRTLVFTATILSTLVIYFFIQATFKEMINWVDLIFLIVIQILTHFLYFPDGEEFGTKNEIFTQNRKSYNEKAKIITSQNKFERLREFCKFEYEQRKERYILNECAFIGITVEQLEIFKEYTEKQIKKLETFEYEKDGNPHLIVFNKTKRKKLYNLLFKPLPIEENKPETIMSGIENNGYSAIHDTSISFTKKSYISKILLSLVISTFLAYIGVTSRDGITVAEVFKIFMYISTLISSAIMAFVMGEKATKVYKNKFYVNLTTFIDEFICWDAKTQSKPIIIEKAPEQI
jgi:hypothetical protein